MKKIVCMAIGFGLLVGNAFQAQALVQGEVTVGRPSFKGAASDTAPGFLQESKATTGTQMGVAVNFDPIPFVPIGFGFSFESAKYTPAKIDGLTDTSLTGVNMGLEVLGWIPNPTKFLPFLRIGYMKGTYKYSYAYDSSLLSSIAGFKSIKVSEAYESSGSKLGVGVAFKVIPFLSLFTEYQMENLSIKQKSSDVSVSSTLVSPSVSDFKTSDLKGTMKNSTILVGVNFGI